jgi:ATP-dependent DNA ligase
MALKTAARIRTDGFVDPCIPTLAAKPPSGPDWVHEIKHDGFRLIVRRDSNAVRLARANTRTPRASRKPITGAVSA